MEHHDVRASPPLWCSTKSSSESPRAPEGSTNAHSLAAPFTILLDAIGRPGVRFFGRLFHVPWAASRSNESFGTGTAATDLCSAFTAHRHVVESVSTALRAARVDVLTNLLERAVDAMAF
eukprot:3492631-Rhodomonas_salina.4